MAKKLIIIIIIIFILFIGIYFLFSNNATNKNKNIANSQNNLNIQNIENNNKLNEENKIEGENIEEMISKIKLTVNNKELTIKLEENSSSESLIEKLKEKDIIIEAHDYGNFEKVGNLGFDLPTNDKQITTQPGDVILYQGNQITIYYDTNTWNFTKLGKIEGISKQELKNILGEGDATLTFSLLK